MSIRLTVRQTEIVETPSESKIFLEGIAGAGKTTIGVHRLRRLIESGAAANSILVLVPQKGLALPYFRELRNPRRKAGADVTIATLGSLARQIVSLFWPLATDHLSRSDPFRRPVFLSLETVQYIMSKVIGAEIEKNNFFASLRIKPGRLYSQIVDNLNKAALVGFPADEIEARLRAATPEDQEQKHIFADAQHCANLFREHCIENNLLDFSLQIELFKHLWKMDAPRSYLSTRFTNIIADNIEEDTPATHDLLLEWLPSCSSAMLIADSDAGYRRFLGADEINAQNLRSLCQEHFRLDETRVMDPNVQALHSELSLTMSDEAPPATGRRRTGEARAAISYPRSDQSRFHTQMLDWIAGEVKALVYDDKVPQSEIVILAPILTDSLRFALAERIEATGVRAYTLRPSRPLHEEPQAKAMMTIAKLAHPQWSIPPSQFDIIQMLMVAIEGVDLGRATLIANRLAVQGHLTSYSDYRDRDTRARVTEVFGARYDELRAWIEAYGAALSERSEPAETIDIFFRRLFGELLSQKGFGFHTGLDAGRIVANLIDSARAFRQTLARIDVDADAGKEYARIVTAGLMTEQSPPPDWRKSPDAVLIAPAYTFLLSNRAVDYQFWLSADSQAWGRRIFQPLTQPYVLSRQWRPGDVWTDKHERSTSHEMLFHVVTGLIKRCRRKIYVGFSQYDERGFERIGPLRESFDQLLGSRSAAPGSAGVLAGSAPATQAAGEDAGVPREEAQA